MLLILPACRRKLIYHVVGWAMIASIRLAIGQTAFAQQSAQVATAASIEICLKKTAQVSGNVVRLSDLVIAESSRGLSADVLGLVLSPSPILKMEQLWEQSTIESLLRLKGFDARAIAWTGSKECLVQRVSEVVMPASATSSPETQVVPAVAMTSSQTFVPSVASEQTISLSQRNAISAIQNYLRSTSDSDFDYEILVDVPSDGIPYLRSRSSIVAVSGGEAPWLGNQRFVLQTKLRDELTNIEVGAVVSMPTRVLATNRSLAKDHILSESDLRLVVLPKSSRVEQSVCFIDMQELVGKQLRRTLATGQVIEKNHIGNPRLISQNDEVEIQVSAAGIMVTTRAKALQGGGMNDLIVVEVLPQRSKVTARVIGPGAVSVIAN